MNRQTSKSILLSLVMCQLKFLSFNPGSLIPWKPLKWEAVHFKCVWGEFWKRYMCLFWSHKFGCTIPLSWGVWQPRQPITYLLALQIRFLCYTFSCKWNYVLNTHFCLTSLIFDNDFWFSHINDFILTSFSHVVE